MPTWVNVWILASAVIASLLTPWFLKREKTVKHNGQEFYTDALPPALRLIVKILTWIIIFAIAPTALIEWLYYTIQEVLKRGKLGK
jgi:Na+/alanine symporter